MIQPAGPILDICDVRKRFGRAVALDGVSFSLEAGERLALLGPNGAGKTTLIRCLSGLAKADSGEIKVLGRAIGRRGATELMGLVPQEIAVYPDLTTRENLIAFGRFHGLRKRDLTERVEWALQWTGLEARVNDLVGTFSGGMKRRVNLACGVLHSPRILLLDEPTVGVDPQSRERIHVMLDDLNARGTSILLTTHHLDEAQAQSDRIVIVDQGRVVAAGSFDHLVEHTIGDDRVVRLRLDRPLSESIEAVVTSGTDTINGFAVERIGDRVLTARIHDVATELPQLINSLQVQGYGVDDIDVRSPSLHHVFLHLTGRQLRD